MRLKKVTQIDPIERISISLRTSTVTQLEQYRAVYEATYGEPIERSHLVEQMLLAFMAGDKDFQKELAKQGKPATAGAPAASQD